MVLILIICRSHPTKLVGSYVHVLLTYRYVLFMQATSYDPTKNKDLFFGHFFHFGTGVAFLLYDVGPLIALITFSIIVGWL